MVEQNSTSALHSKLQLHFIQLIKSMNGDSERICQLLTLIKHILDEQGEDSTETENELINEFRNKFPANTYSKCSISGEFKSSFYSLFMTQILTKITEVNEQTKEAAVSALFVSNFTDTFNILHELCTNFLPPSTHSSSIKTFHIYLMKQYLSKHKLTDLFIEQTENTQHQSLSAFMSIVQKLTNLPDKLCNFSATHKIFDSVNYFRAVSVDLWLSLKHLHNQAVNEQVSLQFLSTVFGKISFLGYTDVLANCVLKQLITHCYIDQSWQTVAKAIYGSIDYKFLESCLLNLIRISSCPGDLKMILGDLLLTNSNIKYYFVDKFLFLKTLNQDKYIQNLIGFIHETSRGEQQQQQQPLYYQIFKNLLNTWSNQTSIVNTSYEQHLYLTKCVLVCISYMREEDKSTLESDLTRYLLNGVEKHLRSPIDSIRTLGMVVSEFLMNYLHSQDPKKLKFDYEITDEIKNLLSLASKPKQFDDSVYKKNSNNNQFENVLLGIESIALSNEKVIFKNDHLDVKITQKEQDSDDDEDDLKPYDLSNDVPAAKANKPLYLRDCLNTLVYSDDPDKFETALDSIEKLCDTYHFELEEICVEMLKVLLNKTNTFASLTFNDTRMSAMICIVVHYPKECACFLTSQFYEPGYSITQRVDILHVLTMSIQKLSSPNEEPVFDKRVFQNQQSAASVDTLIAFNHVTKSSGGGNKQQPEMSWQEVVQKRIDSKTKVKTTQRSNKVAKSKENKFSDVYGYFFFPLLNPFDRNLVHLKILGQDFMLLGKMIFSLSVVLYSSANTIVLENMISALTDFLWTLRGHSEPFVRKSVLFAYVLILMVVPDEQLFAKLTNYFIELKFWLENVILNDPDMECKQRARECIGLTANRLNKKLFASIN